MSDLLINNPASPPGNTIYFAKVTRFYASSNLVDVVTIDDNISLMGCQMLCSMPAGFAFGEKYIPSYEDTNKETSYVMSPADVYCVATFIEDYQQPVVLGFLFPKETTLSIPDYGLYIFRHESDVMWMVRGDGTVQMYHPSGSVIKIGSDNIDEMTNDLMIPTTASNFYRRDPVQYVADKPTSLYIKWHAGQKITLDSDGNIIASTEDAEGAIVTTITATPDGKVTVYSTEQVNVNTKDINVTASGNVVANVTGNADITVEGNVTANVTGNATANVTGNATANVTGNADLEVIGATTVTTAALNINAPLSTALKINGKSTKSGVFHSSHGLILYAEQGFVLL